MSLVTVETTSTLETVLTFLSPLIGVGIGAWATSRVTRKSESAVQRTEVTRALANYMAAAELIAVELGSLPEHSRVERIVDRWTRPQRRIGWTTQRLLERAVFGQRWDELRHRYQQARAELVLVAPIQIIGIVSRIDDVFVTWRDERGDHMKRD